MHEWRTTYKCSLCVSLSLLFCSLLSTAHGDLGEEEGGGLYPRSPYMYIMRWLQLLHMIFYTECE